MAEGSKEFIKLIFNYFIGRKIKFYLSTFNISLRVLQITVLGLIFYTTSQALITKNFHYFLTQPFWLTAIFSIFSVFAIENVIRLASKNNWWLISLVIVIFQTRVFC